MSTHLAQSHLWGKFKEDYGTPVVYAGNVMYTKHKIPFTGSFYAYCPRVNPSDVNFEELKKSMEENNCIALHFDVPNVAKDSPEAETALAILEKYCEKSPRAEFAKGNFIIDLTKSEEELLAGMHNKQRYNMGLAQRKGVTVKEGSADEDFDVFFEIYKQTGMRQKFYYRPKAYLHEVFKSFRSDGLAYILTAYYEGKPLASWMLLKYEDVLYYPYGGSTEEFKNVFASTLVGWEAIKLGKRLNCTLFDMWGATEDMSDTTDTYYGFSLFKQKFGAKHIQYIDSYDFIINPSLYKMFNMANGVRWKILNVLR